ncbi:MAG: DUF6992 family protein [Saprospiraceae bacterium]
MRKALLLFFFFFWTCLLFSQDVNLLKVNEIRIEKQRIGMLIMGTWAVGNMATGALLAGRKQGEAKYFHLMNIGWNAVNLGLATVGYLNAINADPASYDMLSTIKEQYNIEKILLLNTGLDVGYMLGGLYLMERSKNNNKNPERLKGFGKSIILQGAFLFTFDLIFYFTHAQTRSMEWQQLLSNVYFDGNQVGLVLQF